MKKNLLKYYFDWLKNFSLATVNLFIFLPYFFSVKNLLKTLFYPWKNIQTKKTTLGFSFSESFNIFFYNFISSFIGFFMRFSIIIFYFLTQIFLIISLPLIFLISFFLQPFFYFLYLLEKTDEEKKEILKKAFLEKHLLNPINKDKVEEWFEKYYKKYLLKKKWYYLENLLSYPPLARDWSYGYTPNLDQYTQDLASPQYLSHIKNIIDREKEISQIEMALSKSDQNNVLIVGEEGVGRHTIIDALAKKIYLGKTQPSLMYKRILKINMEKISEDQKLLEDLMDEAVQAKNIILFIDNLEKYLKFNISLEKYAKSFHLQIIAVTNPFFYQKYIFTNEKINNLFEKIDVFEVKKDEALNILLEKFYEFEESYNLFLPYETLVDVIEKSQFYITYIPFPEKAIDLLHSSCVYVRQKSDKEKAVVTPQDIDTVLTEKTHIPTTINSQIKDKLLSLELLLKSQVFDQDEAINKLSASLRRSFLLIGKRKKPLATFLFLGPTGVGKTQTAKAIAQVFFSSIKYLIRFDMANYQTVYDIPKLIGDSNTKDPGLLTVAIRNQPYGVLLLDELEKADKNLLNIFLTIIDEGYFIDGFGKHVDCKNLVIIATSNAPSADYFAPEFLNRFDGVINYQPLQKPTLLKISKKIIEELKKDIYSLYQIKLVVSDQTIANLVEKGYDPKFGARNMERVIRDEIEDRIAKEILNNQVKAGDIITL